MAWLFLVIAGVFEVVWAISLKYSNGFTKLVPSAITLAGMGVSFYFLAVATKTLPIGTAYAAWTGIGAVGAIIIGTMFLDEPISLLRILFMVLILVGVLGLKFTSGH
ncbi:quaternary ammonium compound efflux SMR transporter SugE [Paenibacillus roseipurpureus]|uniref:Multidrug efflux SMR transporter n=1 Tax=Paenibacillus roseopurpureus TaxID=2918901 RepID=A0AA96LNG2_9BACL|nr:multidrug efflux SMR transporter [Paenibacillus sp. MBLB1832]WNR44341.1 multidrug efflux SMR transporter [Paenibacillus sp. MBLB1832]